MDNNPTKNGAPGALPAVEANPAWVSPEEKMADIVVFGNSHQGKSSTLQHLAVLLLSGGVNLNPEIVKAFEQKFWTGSNYRDAMIIIPYVRASDGCEARIYLSTKGDVVSVIKGNFDFFYRVGKGTMAKIYVYDGGVFKDWTDLSDDDKERWYAVPPAICISPANFNAGAIQAHRFLLDATHGDWKCEHWLLREKTKKRVHPLPDYTRQTICRTHDNLARNIVGLIDSIIDNKY